MASLRKRGKSRAPPSAPSSNLRQNDNDVTNKDNTNDIKSKLLYYILKSSPRIPGHSIDSARKVLLFAVATRLVIWILAVSSKLFVNDFDSSGQILFDNSNGLDAYSGFSEKFDIASPYSFLGMVPPTSVTSAFATNNLNNSNNINDNTTNIFDTIFKVAFGPFLKWDAFYFLFTAENGYVYEHQLAFFPLYAWLMRVLSATIFRPLTFFVTQRYVLIFSGFVISNVSFILAALSLYRLGLLLFRNERFAFLAALMFCLTPAGIFMSSVYTESLFAFQTFYGLEQFMLGNELTSALVWFSSCLTRSNGVVYGGFFAFEGIQTISRLRFLIEKPKAKTAGSSTSIFCILIRLLKMALCFIVTLSGFAIVQGYGYYQFCHLAPNNIERRPWCHWKLPLSYSFIQNEYWNVGFLKYYELRQIPNFAFALPMIVLSVVGIFTYIWHDPRTFFTLGLFSQESGENNRSSPSTKSSKLSKQPFFSKNLIPFIYLWAFLVFNCLFFVHVQIITRFFSSLPVIYFFAAHLVSISLAKEAKKASKDGVKWWRRFLCPCDMGLMVVKYFLFYALTGVILFANFYPPA